MPPVFGALVAVADALVVLRGRERHRVAAVGQREDGHLLAHEQLLDVERLAERLRGAKPRVELGLGPADPDALARGEPVRLDDARRPRHRERLRRRDARRVHHVLRERLRPFDPRRLRAWAEDGDAAVAQHRRRARSRAAPPDRPRRGRRRARRRAARSTPGRPRARGGSERAPRYRGSRAPRAARSARRCARAPTRARARDRPTPRRAPSRGRSYPGCRTRLTSWRLRRTPSRRSTSSGCPTGRSERDRVAVEEPLEIRIGGRPVAVTMRTPGHDEELALGFCLSEGLRPSAARLPDDLAANTVDVDAPGFDPARLQRSFYTSSSCGVCGKGRARRGRGRCAAGRVGAARAARGRRRAAGPAARRAGGVRRDGRAARDRALRRGGRAALRARGRRPAQRDGQGDRLGLRRRAAAARRDRSCA